MKIYYDTESADDARIGYVIIHLMNNNVEEAKIFLDKNKSKFNKSENYLEAAKLIKNSNKIIKIKGLYISDYIKKLL